jgi:hypothetical protein
MMEYDDDDNWEEVTESHELYNDDDGEDEMPF